MSPRFYKTLISNFELILGRLSNLAYSVVPMCICTCLDCNNKNRDNEFDVDGGYLETLKKLVFEFINAKLLRSHNG